VASSTILQGQSLSGASFTSVEQLQGHIDAFIAAYNETATPFAWTKKRVYQRRFKNRRIPQVSFRVLGTPQNSGRLLCVMPRGSFRPSVSQLSGNLLDHELPSVE
jgi:hypothetical protein